DIGGLIFGRFFGGKKLTKISPNKTISGSLGSFFFSFILVIFLKLIGLLNLNTQVIFYVFATCLSCQLGDIFISYLKRKAKVKDTGNVLPGHGGILDRVDGVLLGVPVGILAYYFVT
ncbi:phosphatidate cytidylyltransferase, partial [Pelagibacteraceae bacterium]|nr:phosphatidate cytidylyltransferase [Pelagibacteraceae bacterium]